MLRLAHNDTEKRPHALRIPLSKESSTPIAQIKDTQQWHQKGSEMSRRWNQRLCKVCKWNRSKSDATRTNLKRCLNRHQQLR